MRYDTIQKHKKATKITAVATGILALFTLAFSATNPSRGLTKVSGFAVNGASAGTGSLMTWVGVLGIVAVVYVTWTYLNSSDSYEPQLSFKSTRKRSSRRKKRR